MPIALILIGVILVVASVRNTQGQLFTLIQGDFTGTNNFVYWLIAILLVGALGQVKAIKPLSNAFLTLIIVAVLLSHKGVIAQFQAAISTTGGTSSNTSETTGASTSLPTLV